MIELLENKDREYAQVMFKVVADAKICPACLRLLTLDHYNHDKSRGHRDGHKTVCRECMRNGIAHYTLPSHEEQEVIARKYCISE